MLQDDVLLRPDFHARVMSAIREKPESLLVAFVPGFARERRIMGEARRAGAAYCRFQVLAYVPTVAVIYPAAVADGFLAWADRERRRATGADDGMLATYCRKRRIHPVALVPCAADHDETEPRIGAHVRRGAHRRAALL